MAGISTQAEVVISPATSTRPVVVAVSQATRACVSWTMMASRTASEIWSHSLSGCPSVTDSLVKNDLALLIKLLMQKLLLLQGTKKTCEYIGIAHMRKKWSKGVLVKGIKKPCISGVWQFCTFPSSCGMHRR